MPGLEVFIFKCRGCGREAPDKFWQPRGGKSGSSPGAILKYPSPQCPKCQSINVDVNHDYKEGAEAAVYVKKWRDENLLVSQPDTNTKPPS